MERTSGERFSGNLSTSSRSRKRRKRYRPGLRRCKSEPSIQMAHEVDLWKNGMGQYKTLPACIYHTITVFTMLYRILTN